MISKNEVKYIQSLSDKKNRDQHNVFIAEGPKVVAEMLTNGVAAQMIYVINKTAAYHAEDLPVKEITSSELQRISLFDKANEVVGIFYKKNLPILQLKNRFTIVLDGIQDPGNLGTIIRTADWFSIRQIIASPDCADCYNSKVVRSTMGSIARVNVYYQDIADSLRNVTVPVFGAQLNGKNLYEVFKVSEGILVIGNESKGIRSDVIPFIQESVTIPGSGSAESLNAAVATGILLSHLLHA